MSLPEYIKRVSDSYELDKLDDKFLLWFIYAHWDLFNELYRITHVSISSAKWRELWPNLNNKINITNFYIPSWKEVFTSRKVW